MRAFLGLLSFALHALSALPRARRPGRSSACDGCGAPMPGRHRVPGPGEFWNLAACRVHPRCPMPEAEAERAAAGRSRPFQPGR